MASTPRRTPQGPAQRSDAPRPPRTPDSHPADRSPRSTGPLLALLGTAWALTVLLAVLDELASVDHGPLVLASALTLVMGLALLARFQTRPKAERPPSRQEPATELDPLTGLPTGSFFQQRLEEERYRFVRYGDPFSVVLTDINNLSAINREHGPAAGDEVLRHVARSIRDTKRLSDVLARVGDDEFGIILQGCDERGAIAFVQRLEDRLARESATVEIDGRSISVWVGVCAGVAAGGAGDSDSRQTLARAMVNLSAAKQGREKRRRLWLSSA